MTITTRTEPDYDAISAAYRNFHGLAYPADNPEGSIDSRELRSAFRPGAIVGMAHRIYDYMGEHNVGVDSATREAAFAYAAADTGLDYEVIYNAWLTGEEITLPCRTCSTPTQARLLTTVPGECSDCVGEMIRERYPR